MTALPDIPGDETGFDRVFGFALPERNARGRLVRLGPVLDAVLSAHDYAPPIRHLLAEALALTALLGSLLKQGEGQLTMQAQTERGVIDLLVCDYKGGEVRGYVRHDADRLATLGANPTLHALFGQGYLAITFDLATTGERYQGIVPLEGDSLSQACETYFAQSEQVPTLIRTAVQWDGHRCIAGGLLVQHLAEGEEGRTRLHVRMDHPQWEHVTALAGSIRHEELVEPSLSLEALAWRLFGGEDEIRAQQLASLSRGCRCTEDHYRAVLKRFPEADRADMRDAEGLVTIDCAFCSKIFRIAA